MDKNTPKYINKEKIYRKGLLDGINPFINHNKIITTKPTTDKVIMSLDSFNK